MQVFNVSNLHNYPAIFLVNRNLIFDSPGSFWIQVHLDPPQTVTGIITQGRPGNNNQYTTFFNVSYSNDGNDFTEIRKVIS